MRHEAASGSFQAADQDTPGVREAVEAHLAAHLGECDLVWHELASHLVHVDVFMWRPTDQRPMYTFATVGMSDLRMTVPTDWEIPEIAPRAELLICLPPTWPVPEDAYSIAPWDSEEAYFPIRWLKQLARLPHEHQTWLGFGHSVPNDDPPLPLADTTQLCGWVLLPPMTLPRSIDSAPLPNGETLGIFGIIALHRDEIDHKLEHGVDGLLDGFDRNRVNELLDLHRPSSLR